MRMAILAAGVLALAQTSGLGVGTPSEQTNGGLGSYSDQTAPSVRSIEGSVTSTSPDQVTVLGVGGRRLDLVVDRHTEIQRGGAKVERRQLSPGEQVRASYDVRDGQAHALSIDVVQSGAVKPKNGD